MAGVKSEDDGMMVSSLLLSLLVISPVRGSEKKRGNGGTPHGVAAARCHAQNGARSGMLASFLMLSAFLSVPRPCDPIPRQSGDTFLPFLVSFMCRR